MRAMDRHTANQILQIVVTAIPPKSGRVTHWLGPSYFDELLPITAGEPVRVLRTNDKAKFRNAYKNTSLIRGTASVVGVDDVEVTVSENFGQRVVIRNSAGAEQVLQCGDLRRCALLNPHTKRDDPWTSALYHAWNAKQVIQDGMTVEYMDNEAWVKTRVLRTERLLPDDPNWTVDEGHSTPRGGGSSSRKTGSSRGKYNSYTHWWFSSPPR